jgi:hypothetical protein
MAARRKKLYVVATFVALTIGSIFGGHIVVNEYHVRRAIAEVASLHGAVDDLSYPPRRVTFALMGIDPTITDSGFQRLLPYLASFGGLEEIDLSGTSVTADGLKGIDGLKTLKRLDLPARCVAEPATESIAALKLRVLYLYGGQVPGNAVARLRRISPGTEIHVINRRWSQPSP